MHHTLHKLFATVTTTLLFTAIATADTPSASDRDWLQSNTKAVNETIIKPYHQLAHRTKKLNHAVSQLCSAIEPKKDKDNAQLAFRSMFQQWARVQFVAIGPMAYLQRTERFQYWPDKHAVASRQLRRLLQQETNKHRNNQPLLTLAQLQKKSVAVQGIPALERLLFNTKDSFNEVECHLAKIISQNLHIIAQENIDAWIQAPTLFVNEMIHIERGFGVYASNKQVANLLFNMLSTQLLVIDQLKLQRALPKEGKPSKPTRLEAWKSQLSLSLIQENIYSLQQLYQHGFHTHLKQKNSRTAKRIMVEFHQINALLKHSSLPLAEYIDTASIHPTIKKILSKLSTLQALVNTNMANELQLMTKFNALDGD